MELDKEINILNLLKNAKKISIDTFISDFNNVSYSLIIQNNKLKQISYKDEIENDVVILFTNVKQNHTINQKVFKYFIPFDFDIIKK